MQTTTEKDTQSQDESEEQTTSLSPQTVTTGSNPKTSWTGLWNRYKNLWRIRRKVRNIKATGIKFTLLIGIFTLASGSFAGLMLASFAGVFLITYESYKGNIDPFISGHIGIIATIPSVVLSLSLLLSAPGLVDSVTGVMISVMYTVMYPMLYYVYSNIGVSMSEQNGAFN